MSKIKNGLFIGRFQVPTPHAGHRSVLSQAASQCEHLLILVGSANSCPSIKNPWSIRYRINSVRNMMHAQGFTNFTILPLNDYPYSDDQWMNDVRATVNHVFSSQNITLFGHFKDGNDYLKWFPEWKYREISSNVNINATQIRELMFSENNPSIPETVRDDWIYYTVTEPEKFKDYPFPETLNFNCGDALLVCSGHIVLIRRARTPGRGTWALPGGFKNGNETFLQCAIREAEEETNIKVPQKVLIGSIADKQLFDSPNRSFGIPRSTLAVLFNIKPNPDGSLPKVRAADDAVECDWFPLHQALNEMQLYDDHQAIISVMTKTMPQPAYLTWNFS